MRFWLPPSAVVALAAALLIAPVSVVRGDGTGVRLLGDTDPHYHVLRAERMAHGAAWRDPALDFPNGADVPWPPLFDAAIWGAARVTGAETRDAIAATAAFVPVVLGLLCVLLVGVVARAVAGGRAGIAAAVIAAFTPGLARYAVVGRVDQHIAETLLATGIAGAFVAAIERRPRPWPALALGAAIAMSFWTWMGSTVALLAPCATIALAHLAGVPDIAVRGARTLAIAAAAAALALVATIPVFGPPGALASASLLGIGGLHVAIVAGVAAFAAIIAWRAIHPGGWGRRALELALALALPAAILFLVWPGLLDGVRRGLVALAAANPWYSDIREFNPAFFGGVRPVSRELGEVLGSLGLVPVASAVGVAEIVRRWRATPAQRPALFFLATWTAVTFALALARVRFFPYFVVPAAISAALAATAAADRAASRLGRGAALAVTAAVIGIALVPCIAPLRSLAAGRDRVPDAWVAAARWLGTAPRDPDGRVAVAAPWSFGHLVQYYADRPVIASPFGTEAGPRALPDWASFLFARDAAVAEATLLARRVSLVVLRNPSHELVGLRGFAPAGAVPPLVVTRDRWRGEDVRATAAYADLVVYRLYFEDGAGALPLDAARLVFETPGTRPEVPLRDDRVKVFELVPGATLRVHGAEPGAVVTASVPVLTNTRRAYSWSLRRTASATGDVEFRIPYATGSNGAVLAGPCEVVARARAASASVSPDAVATGAVVPVTLAAASR